MGYNGKDTTHPFPFLTFTNIRPFTALPFLHHTEIMLGPVFILVVLWAVSLFGFNLAKHIIPVLLGK